MPVHSTHPEYDFNLPAGLRIRDVLTGDAAIKAAGENYVPRLHAQPDDEFRAYIQRGFFCNGVAAFAATRPPWNSRHRKCVSLSETFANFALVVLLPWRISCTLSWGTRQREGIRSVLIPIIPPKSGQGRGWAGDRG